MEKSTVLVTFDLTNFNEHRKYSEHELMSTVDYCGQEISKPEFHSLLAQDMIADVQKNNNNCTVEEAVTLVINKENMLSARDGLGDLGFTLWGHGEPRGYWANESFMTLDKTLIEVELTEEQIDLLNKTLIMYGHVAKDITMAMCYLLTYEMERLGHHI